MNVFLRTDREVGLYGNVGWRLGKVFSGQRCESLHGVLLYEFKPVD